MADPVPAVAGTSQALLAYRPSSHEAAAQQNCNRANAEQPAQPAVEHSPECVPTHDEAKQSTVDAAVPLFLREFPDFGEDDANQALAACYRADNTIQMLIEGAFEYLVAKLTGAPPEEGPQQPPEGQQIVENMQVPAGDPADEEEAFKQETLQMAQAMQLSEVQSAAHKKLQEKPMYQWTIQEFQEQFANSIILPEIAKRCPGAGIDRMCTKETACEVEKLLKNEKCSQRWYKTERGLPGYWRALTDALVHAAQGLPALSTPAQSASDSAAQTSQQANIPPTAPQASPRPHRKRNLRSIDADPATKTKLQCVASSTMPYGRPAAIHSRCSSATPPADTEHSGPVATAPAPTQGSVSTSKAAGSCALSESGCQGGRPVQSRAGSVGPSWEANVEPKRVAGDASGQGIAATCCSRPTVPDSTTVMGGSADESVRIPDQAGGAGALHAEQSQETLQGSVGEGEGGDGGKENNRKQHDATAGISGVGERGGEKMKEADGGSVETGQGAGVKLSRIQPPPAAKDAPGNESKGQGNENYQEKVDCPTSDVVKSSVDGGEPAAAQEKVKTEEEVIGEVSTVLKQLNRRFEEEVVAVAAKPEKLAAFVPFRPAEESGQGEDGDIVPVCDGVTERKSAEGVIQIEID